MTLGTYSQCCLSVRLSPSLQVTHTHLRVSPRAVWEVTALLTQFCPSRSPGVYICGGTGGDLGLLSWDSTDRGLISAPGSCIYLPAGSESGEKTV